MATSIPKVLNGVRPLQGQIVSIRSIQELHPQEQFDKAYVAEVQLKSASKVIKALDAAFPRDSVSLRHIRRFATHDFLPGHLRSATPQDLSLQTTIYVLILPPLPEISALLNVLAPFVPVRVSSEEDEKNENENGNNCEELSSAARVHIQSTQIPLHPPLSAQQAERWSRTLWPVKYNPTAPRSFIAPPPHDLNQARQSIQPLAGFYLSLAHQVADEARNSGRGRHVGAVVVDPTITTGDDWMAGVVAVAGDARYCPRGGAADSVLPPLGGPSPAERLYNPDLEGGPHLHSVMRAASIIASAQREGDSDSIPESSPLPSPPALVPPLSPLEAYFLFSPSLAPSSSVAQPEHSPSSAPASPITRPSRGRIPIRSQGGYLCNGLDIYITHEPCLSCSMGLLLSRIRAVIFPRRGRMDTGGLASEPIPKDPLGRECSDGKGQHRQHSPEHSASSAVPRNYYGLHWRSELNWRVLGFEFVEDEDDLEDEGDVTETSSHRSRNNSRSRQEGNIVTFHA
ncbi:hypothetical protein V8E54_007169 [Elaphomyces granulatus]